jgi:hypothetical protein
MRKLTEAQRNEVTMIQHFLDFGSVEDALGDLSVGMLAALREECIQSIQGQTLIVAMIDAG